MRSAHRASPLLQRHEYSVVSQAPRSFAQNILSGYRKLTRAAFLVLCAASAGTLVHNTTVPARVSVPMVHAVSAAFGVTPAWAATAKKNETQQTKKSTNKKAAPTAKPAAKAKTTAKAKTAPAKNTKAKTSTKTTKAKTQAKNSTSVKAQVRASKAATQKARVAKVKPTSNVKQYQMKRVVRVAKANPTVVQPQDLDDTRQIASSTRKPGRMMSNHIYVEEEALASLHRDIESQKSDSLSVNRTAAIDDSSSLYLRKQTAAGAVTGEVQSSLLSAGIPAGIIKQMHTAFDGTNDLVQQMRRGDTFRVIYEAEYAQNRLTGYGKLLSLEVTNAGKRTRLFWYPVDEEHGFFFDEDGNAAQTPFIRVPLDVKEVSSEFQPMRRHPVTGKLRPHQGTDFRAPRGTTVRSAADGRVTFAGWGRGYGKMIKIDHGNGYETVYAHLLNIDPAVRQGAYVLRGKPIGAVGKTGVATGYHLHYELKHNGVQINPLTAKVSSAPQLTAQQKRDLKIRIAALQQTMDHMARAPKQVAQHTN